MARKRSDGAYQHENEVFDFLEERLDMCLDIKGGNKERHADAVCLLMGHFGFDSEQAQERLDDYLEWTSDSFNIKCSQCGSVIEVGHCTSMHGCVCGAVYVIDGWKKYHRDDTGRGTVTREIASSGTEIITVHLDH